MQPSANFPLGHFKALVFRDARAAIVHRDRVAEGRDARAAGHAEPALAGAAGQGGGPLLRRRRQLQEGVRVVHGAGIVTDT